MSLARVIAFGMALLSAVTYAHAQTTILFQGFESPAPCGSWGYTGGVVNTETVRTGANSSRIGRNAQSNTITFNTVNIAGLAGVQLRFYHAVRPGSGPGMDVREGVVVQVALNGGAWTNVGQIGGANDHNYAWANPIGGAVGTGCTDYQLPNPFIYNVPGGTNTIAFRALSVVGGTCAAFDANMAAAVAGNYDRNDEGFFIDDVALVTTTPGPYPFIWTGAFDTNWHDCRNWNLGVVPNATSNVIIDQSAVNNCEVTLAATCASLALSSNNGVARNLAVRNGVTLDVQGPVTVTKTGLGAVSVGITVGDLALAQNGTLQATSLTMTGTATGALNAFVRGERALSILRVNGPVTVQPGGYLDLQGTATGGSLQLQGNYTNNDGEAAFDEQFSLVTFWGGAAQSINTAGFQERFGAIRMSKAAGDLTLNAPISVRTANNALQFAQNSPLGGATLGGRIMSSLPGGLLTLESTVLTTLNATDNSHVNGPVQKFGNVNFIFPIGKNNRWRPVQLQNIAGLATDAFIAEYFPVSAYTLSSVMEPTLDHISDCEYWSITRSVGTANARVVLSYHNTFSCGVTLPADLRVARLDEVPAPDIWRDRGNNGATTQLWGGYVPTTAVETEFGFWTLASISAENPLPIELLWFDAKPEKNVVHCSWSTASEWNNAYFTVERSADGLLFEPLGLVESQGDGATVRYYRFTDEAPLPGTSFYRLRQTDHDGTFVHSVVVAVEMTAPHGVRVIVREGELEVWHDLPAGTPWSLLDASGRLVSAGTLQEAKSIIAMSANPPGVYLFQTRSQSGAETIRFVK